MRYEARLHGLGYRTMIRATRQCKITYKFLMVACWHSHSCVDCDVAETAGLAMRRKELNKLIYEHAHNNVANYYGLVAETFAFLPEKYKKYKYKLDEQRLDGIDFWPDMEALMMYVGEKIEVDVIWSCANAAISVRFVELFIPRVSPYNRHVLAKAHPRVANLDEIAELRGHADDPDFLLHDNSPVTDIQHINWRAYNKAQSKRFELLETNFKGVLEGLARATERFASDVLKGDTALFAEIIPIRDAKRKALGF
jgi:hypothetical protein